MSPFLFFIPQDTERLLYDHMLVLHSVRNSASVLKQFKCTLRDVRHLIKDLCVQYMVPKWVLEVGCFKNTYLIPLVQYFVIHYKFLASTVAVFQRTNPFWNPIKPLQLSFFKLTSMMMPMEKSIVIGQLVQLLSISHCYLALPMSFCIHPFFILYTVFTLLCEYLSLC